MIATGSPPWLRPRRNGSDRWTFDQQRRARLRAAIEEGDEDEVAELFATNFFGPIAPIKAVLPGMRACRSGAIVNVSSIGAPRSNAGSGYYAATEAALEAASDGLRR